MPVIIDGKSIPINDRFVFRLSLVQTFATSLPSYRGWVAAIDGQFHGNDRLLNAFEEWSLYGTSFNWSIRLWVYMWVKKRYYKIYFRAFSSSIDMPSISMKFLVKQNSFSREKKKGDLEIKKKSSFLHQLLFVNLKSISTNVPNLLTRLYDVYVVNLTRL